LEVIIELVKENLSIVFLGAITVFEIVPIKLKPWTWFGNLLLGDVRRDLAELKRDFEETKANDMRWNILNFANSCRRHEEHGTDEWRHVISQISEYEDYTKRKKIQNGVIEEDTKYLRELYHDRNVKNDFL
jgi:hypothetical protein